MTTLIRKALSAGMVFAMGSMVSAREPDLESVAAIRSKASRGEETGVVKVRGFVTFWMPQAGIAFVQDETSGVAFFPRRMEGERTIKLGDTVELTGVPIVREGMLTLCGEGSTREAPKPPLATWPAEETKVRPRQFDLSSASQIRVNAELVHASGIVRRIVKLPSQGMVAEISSTVGYVVVRMPWIADDETTRQWINHEAAFNGVLVCRADKKLLPGDADAVVFVSTLSQWQPRPGVLNAVFAEYPLSAAQINRTVPLDRPTGRLHVMGTITAIRMPSTLFLRTSDGSVEISTRQAKNFKVGEKISAACGLLKKQDRVVLTDGVCRSHGTFETTNPVLVHSADEAVKAGYGELLHFNARVRDVFQDHEQGRLLVSLDKGGTCAVRWEPPVTADELVKAGVGALFDVTGICETGETAELGAHFTLRPRSNDDVRLVSAAPKWTRQGLTRALLILLLVAGVAVPGAVFLRWKLWKQEQKIREIERAAASADERQRIAREFHDSLQQQLCSASLHLDNVREACESAPEMMPAMLSDISAMLRHCQAEARNSIWDLRADGEFREGVAPSLRSWLAMRQRLVPELKLEFEVEGDAPEKLTPDACLQVLRITQEAVNNAITHAQASKVQVKMKLATNGMEVLVEDDGRGFNLATAPVATQGHYGLSMLQERAKRIHARVDLRSEKDRGTWVRLLVPRLA